MAQDCEINHPPILTLDTPDWGAELVAAAQKGDAFADKVIGLYALLYGKEAANLALKCMPCGGVYLGGGIAPKIMPWLEKYFMAGFRDKGRFGPLLEQTPVHVVLDPLNGLKGAALQFAS
jgi:glucokinase